MGNKSNNVQRGRYSGGISIYFRKSLQKYITVVEKPQNGIAWVVLSKERFNLEDSVCICWTYNHTIQSTVIDNENFSFCLRIRKGIRVIQKQS